MALKEHKYRCNPEHIHRDRHTNTHIFTHAHTSTHIHKHASEYTSTVYLPKTQFWCAFLINDREKHKHEEGQTRPNTEFDEWFIQRWGRAARWENFLMVSASSSLLSQLSSFAVFFGAQS